MLRPIRLLLLEDSPEEAELLLCELREAGFQPEWKRVDTEADYLAQLRTGTEMILAEDTLPTLDAPRALRLLQELQLDIPFLIVTGAAGEERAVNCIKDGATDYLLKDRLARLGPAVARALREKGLRDEKWKAQEMLKKSEERFRSVIDAAQDVITVLDVDGTITYQSPSIESVLGYRPEERLGRNAMELVHPEDRNEAAGKLAKAFERPGSTHSLTARFRHRDGSWRVLEAIGTSHLTSDGRRQGVIDSRDVTRRVETEVQLRASEARYRTWVENAPISIYEIDLNGRLTWMNEAGLRMIGVTDESEIVGLSYLEVIDEKDRERVRALLAEACQGQRSEFEFRTNGNRFSTIFASGFYPVLDDEGRALKVMGLTQDITIRKRMEEALRLTVEGTSSATGAQFFRSLARYLAAAIQTRFGFVAELVDAEDERVRLVSLWAKDRYIDNFEYDTKGTPCHDVIAKKLVYVPRGVQQRYPDDHLLAEAGVDSYLAIPLFDSSGKPIGHLGVMHDEPMDESFPAESILKIFAARAAAELERKRAEDELWREKEFSQHLINSSADGILAFDRECRYTLWNPGMERISRIGRAQVLGKCAFDVFPFLKETGEDRMFSKALAGETAVSKDTPFYIPQTGVSGYFEGQYTPVRDDSGEIVGGLAIIRDTTERKRTEMEQTRLQQAMEKSALEWRLTFDAVESAVLIVDMDGKIVRINEATKRLLEIDYGKIMGRAVAAVGPGQPWQQAAQLVKVVRASRSQSSCQARDVSSGRSWDIAASLCDAPGVDERIILVAREITSMVELQKSLRRSELLSAMGSLVAGVAHGVRNPLFGISATLDAFEASFPEREDFKRYTDVLRRETVRLAELMQDLLHYGRPPSQEISEGPIGDVIAQAVQLCEAQAERMQVKLVNKVAKGFAPAQLDGSRFYLVFQNLIENAIEHSPTGAVVTAKANTFREDGRNWVCCHIEDSGPGFRVEDLPNVFEPFFTRRRNGTGLGLSIAQRIVEDHKGKISVDNRPKGGAVVTVTFPLTSGDS